MNIQLRNATKADLAEVLNLIRELAIYEKAEQEVTIRLEELEKDGFGDHPLFYIVLAEMENEIVGMAFYYISYSTWKGKCIYLEDIIVKQERRGHGIGGKLFEEMMQRAAKFGANRLSWQVLDWNKPAIHFYEKYKANLDSEWINGTLTPAQLNERLK